MSGKGRRGKSTSVGNVTKKDTAQKHFRRSLVQSVDQSVPLCSCQVIIVLQPMAFTAVTVMNHVVYVMADAAGEPLVRAKIVWFWIMCNGLGDVDVIVIRKGAVVGDS